MAKTKTFVYIVAPGRRPYLPQYMFPIDMLRYDGSSFMVKRDEELASKEEIPSALRQYSLKGPRRPNKERWESFGWKVILVHKS